MKSSQVQSSAWVPARSQLASARDLEERDGDALVVALRLLCEDVPDHMVGGQERLQAHLRVPIAPAGARDAGESLFEQPLGEEILPFQPQEEAQRQPQLRGEMRLHLRHHLQIRQHHSYGHSHVLYHLYLH